MSTFYETHAQNGHYSTAQCCVTLFICRESISLSLCLLRFCMASEPEMNATPSSLIEEWRPFMTFWLGLNLSCRLLGNPGFSALFSVSKLMPVIRSVPVGPFCLSVCPLRWYNYHGWLGVKNQYIDKIIYHLSELPISLYTPVLSLCSSTPMLHFDFIFGLMFPPVSYYWGCRN